MSKKFIKSFAAFLLVLCMMLTNFGGWNLSLAEDTPENNQVEQKEQLEADELKDESDKDKENPAQDNAEEDELKPLEQDAKEADNDGFEMSEEVKPESVGAVTIPAPSINKVFIGDTSISGKKIV